MSYYDSASKLYLIADANACHYHSLLDTVRLAISQGVTCVQLRDKRANKKELHAMALALKTFLDTYRVPLIINDHSDIAHAVDATGVHLGQQDQSIAEARKILGPHKIIGLSIQTEDQFLQQQFYDVDYFGVGPVFSTSSKIDAAPPIGINSLERIVQLSIKPIIAIGGININNAANIMETGVAGIAVISAICNDPHPDRATQQLAQTIQQHRAATYETL